MARSLKCAVAALGALWLSCTPMKQLALSGSSGALLQQATAVVDALEERAECEKLAAEPSLEEEYALGGAVALNWVQRGGGLLDAHTEKKLLRYLNVVGRNLGAQSPRPTLQWTFGILRTTESFNATSSPGGYVFVTLGLLRGVENEAQLAGVLAHEIAHITSKHALARYNEVKVGQCQTAVAFRAGKELVNLSQLHLSTRAVDELLGFLKSGSGALNLDQHVELLGGLAEASVELLVEKGFGKEDEYAADELAVRMLVSAGYDPRDYIQFLHKIPDSRGSFANHPRNADRVKRLEALLRDSQGPGEGFPELALDSRGLARPALPPGFPSAKKAVARDKP